MIKTQKRTAKDSEFKKETVQKICDVIACAFECAAILAGVLVIYATGICAYEAGWFAPRL